MKNIILFFGAGISRLSGLPLVADIEKKLLEETYIFKDRTFQIAEKSDETIAEIQSFLTLLKTTDEYYLKNISPRKTKNGVMYSGALYRSENNYEVLYYLCEQIYLESIGQTDLPMIGAFIEKIASTNFDNINKIETILKIEKLALKSMQFIQWVLNKSLNIKIKEIKGFELINELVNSSEIGNITIITLNHDTLIETYFSDKNIPYSDGFGGIVNEDESKFYGFQNHKIRLIKPHGSLNWYTKKNGREEAYFKIKQGDSLENPNFLTGAGKIEKYQYSIYSEMMFEVHKALNKNNLMIMSGYGWSDAAMNGRLGRWLDRAGSKLILLHGENWELDEKGDVVRKGLLANSIYLEGIIKDEEGKYGGEYLSTGKLIKIDKYMCDTNLEEIEQYIL